MKPNKIKTACDAGTSTGGMCNNPASSISRDAEIVKMLNALGAEQRANSGRIQLCPRCGWHTLGTNIAENPISISDADVHICRYCLQDEIGLRAAGLEPKPLESWDYVRRIGNDC